MGISSRHSKYNFIWLKCLRNGTHKRANNKVTVICLARISGGKVKADSLGAQRITWQLAWRCGRGCSGLSFRRRSLLDKGMMGLFMKFLDFNYNEYFACLVSTGRTYTLIQNTAFGTFSPLGSFPMILQLTLRFPSCGNRWALWDLWPYKVASIRKCLSDPRSSALTLTVNIWSFFSSFTLEGNGIILL